MKTLIASYALMSVVLGAGSVFAYTTTTQPSKSAISNQSQAVGLSVGQDVKVAYTKYCDCTVYADGSKWCQCW